jgi:hypothetical protein
MPSFAKYVKPTSVVLFVPVAVQWLWLLELSSRAAWQWFKFAGYGGDGHAIVSVEGAQFFIVATLIVAALYGFLWRTSSQVAKLGVASVFGGGILFAALLFASIVRVA